MAVLFSIVARTYSFFPLMSQLQQSIAKEHPVTYHSEDELFM